MARTRLTPEQRRDQLLDLGAGMFASHSYDEVWIDEIARRAGVSRGLLYHYFPNKKEFFLALLRRECSRMVERTRADPTAGVLEQLDHGVDAYLSYCRHHADGIKLIYSGWGSADPDVQAIVTADLRAQEDRIVGVLSPATGAAHPLVRVAVRGWLAFVRSVCHDWLDAPDVEQATVRSLCATNLLATLAALPDGIRPDAVA